MTLVHNNSMESVPLIHPHKLAKDLHSHQEYVLLDCRPVLAYNSCHISGAVNVNFTGMMKKRFISGKIGLADLVTTEEGRTRFRNSDTSPTVVYDEDTSDIKSLSTSQSLFLVVSALANMGRDMYILEGGLSEFGVLHPSLCEISVPKPLPKHYLPPPPRASTPGMRDQALDWHTAPPVQVLSFLVLGSEKDAKSKMVFDLFNITHVLNVTPACPNQFEGEGVVYKRIPVSDTGTQKLSNKFSEAFQYIEEVRAKNAVILIHCMAGISRSVTLTIAYLMAHFNMSMQDAYQYVKDKRPAISPNLNFMGQLVEFERELQRNPSSIKLELSSYLPTKEQKEVSDKLLEKISRTSSTNLLSGVPILESPQEKDHVDTATCTSSAVPNSQPHAPFFLKPLNPKGKRGKKLKEALESREKNESEPITNSAAESTDLPDPTSTSQSTFIANISPVPLPTSTDKSQVKSDLPCSDVLLSHEITKLSVKGEKLSLRERRSNSPSSSPERLKDSTNVSD